VRAAAELARQTTTAAPVRGRLQRACACGQHTGTGTVCEACRKKRAGRLQRTPLAPPGAAAGDLAPPIVHQVLRAPGLPLSPSLRAAVEPRFGHDFSQVRVYADDQAAASARAVAALAYTVGNRVVFGAGQYQPDQPAGRRLLAHELAHVVQQGRTVDPGGPLRIDSGANPAEAEAERAGDGAAPELASAGPALQRRAAPYIKKITVDLTPKQTASLEWEGTPPDTATGSDEFTVSTGKGYGDPGDPAGTCTRDCCRDPLTQCAPPWNQPTRVGACCTYYGDSYWTGTPLTEHNTWKWWTPIQPYYSTRGIALHQHTQVTGEPIGHGCVRMDEPNAKRIYDFSNGRRTNVTITGRAAPVACAEDRRCPDARPATRGGAGAVTETAPGEEALAQAPAVPGLEGVLT
jgi:hypothetical protein